MREKGKIRIGRWIYPSKPEKVRHYPIDGTVCLNACDPSSSMLDREDLNVGTITHRKRESGNKRRDEKQIQMINVMYQEG
jgi:hypothetical protein